MTREECIDFANALKNNYTIDFDKLPEFCDMAISALSTDGEYIKKEDALNAIRKSAHYGQTQKIYVCHREVVDSIDDLPTYTFPDSAENKGEWIVVADSYHEDGTMYEYHWECSKCGGGRSGWGEFKFCPDCGADMRGKGMNIVDLDKLSELFWDGNFMEIHKDDIPSIPSAFDGMTNGEVMQIVYADSEICIDEVWKTVTVYLGADEDYCEDEVRFDLDWWNAPYKAESEG